MGDFFFGKNPKAVWQKAKTDYIIAVLCSGTDRLENQLVGFWLLASTKQQKKNNKIKM